MSDPTETVSNPATDTAKGRINLYHRVELLSHQKHRELSLQEVGTFNFAAKLNAAPLMGPEFIRAQHAYPIVFTTHEPILPIAVLAMRDHDNQFLDEQGKWRALTYIPAYIRRYPFIFMERDQDGQRQFVLAANMDPDFLAPGTQRPLFEGENPSPLLKRALEFCQIFQAQYEETLQFTKALQEHQLLEPRGITITRPDRPRREVGGFQLIVPERLSTLPEATVAAWHQRGWLSWIYFHLAAGENWMLMPIPEEAAAPAAPAEVVSTRH